ncbi:hypothetical protein DFH09DRAFT_1301011 [Mycena vulgaris]|nr:hypothetical protein DFH09DRAFT_1301011 [Mycena vulgaris]
MGPGRPRLDPDIKQQNLENSRRRYDQKNAAKRREEARLRMQKFVRRAAIKASDIFTQRKYAQQGAEAADSPNSRKHEEQRTMQRAADATRKQARDIEVQALRKKHTQVAKPPPRTPARKLVPSTPLPISEHILTPQLRKQSQRCPHCYVEECIGCACMCPDSDEWFEHPEGHFFPTCKWCGPPWYTGVLLCEPVYVPDAGHEDKLKHPGPFYAVVCREWKGALTSVASRDKMLERYPHAYTWEAAPWSIFHRMWDLDCTEYHDHSDLPAVTPESSVPSSPSSLTTSTTSRRPSPSPSPPPRTALLPRPSVSSAPHQIVSLPSSAPHQIVSSSSPASSTKLTKEDLAFLASFRPAPGPISPRRLNQHFARALGPQAVAASSTPPAASSTPRAREGSPAAGFEAPGPSLRMDAQVVKARLRAGSPISVGSKSHADVQHVEVPRTPPHTSRAGGGQPKQQAARGLHRSSRREPIHRDTPIDEPEPETMYAVSGHNRVFKNRGVLPLFFECDFLLMDLFFRDRAVTVFHRTPGAELLFTRDEDEVSNFLAESVAKVKF